jgi:hypothetical protein
LLGALEPDSQLNPEFREHPRLSATGRMSVPNDVI